jgi:hypothetical protein
MSCFSYLLSDVTYALHKGLNNDLICMIKELTVVEGLYATGLNHIKNEVKVK